MPLEKEINELAGLADLLRKQMGDSGMDTALTQFNRGGAQADARIQTAQVESQKDPRDLFDKLQPGILGLGAIIDMAKGRRNTPGKLQAYLAEAQKGVDKKKADSRQKFLDKMAQEEMIGKRRVTALSAALDVSGQKQATNRTALGTAKDMTIAGTPKPLNAKEKREFERQTNADRMLAEIPMEEWDNSMYAYYNSVYPNASLTPPEEINSERLREAIKSVNDQMKLYDTSNMNPVEIQSLRASLIKDELALHISDDEFKGFDFDAIPPTQAGNLSERPTPQLGTPGGEKYLEYRKKQDEEKRAIEELLKMFKGSGGRLGVQ